MAVSSRSRFPRTFARGQRRKTSWALGPKSSTSGGQTSVSASVAQLGGIGASAALDGITVVRIRGEFVFQLLTASALQEGFHGAFGIGLARSPAFTAGIASLPTPITDEFQDNWLYHRYFSCIANGGISAAGVSLSAGQQDATSAALRVEVDSKAMRKMNIGDVIYCSVEVIEAGSATGAWAFNSRMLVKQQ